MISIVIPCKDAHEYTIECLTAIKNYTKDYEVILVDNGSDPKYDYHYALDQLIPSINIIRNEENLGFPKAVNQGLNIAEGDYLCIFNNDIIATPHWWDYLKEHMDNGADLVGPMTNYITGPQQVRVPIYRNEEELKEVAANFHIENFHKYRYLSQLFGFCLVFSRKVYETIGGLDEQFGIGNAEDNDYSFRSLEAGFKLVMAMDVFVHHYGSVTHRILDLDYNKLLKDNRKKLMDKWGKKLIDGLIEKDKEADYYDKERRF
jgi:GT2 family glycosyltransferase